ncbi:MAG TPA: methyltransferase domain-containing protein [Dehalococcoidia bacterium]|nr:methyltransferase domain-containing protein [Dehalococcoidia bacterium]
MYQLEDHLWWYVGMRRICDKILRRHLEQTQGLEVLDAGCGTGGSLALLERFGRVTAFDVYPRAAQLTEGRRAGRVAVASIDAMPYADASFDLVTSFEVVCQLEPASEERALRELARVLRPGGTLLVRVPAFQMLYGPHDATVQTKHRYTAPEMARKLEKVGLRPVQTTYANMLLLPVAVVRRLAAKLLGARGSDVRPVPAPLNAALQAVLKFEGDLLERHNLPIGLSVIALATKP